MAPKPPLSTAFARGSRKPALDPEALAAEALQLLAAEPERLGRFLTLTGLDPAGLRKASAQSGFAMAVLSYLCGDEPLLLAFAETVQIDPAAIGQLVQAQVEKGLWSG